MGSVRFVWLGSVDERPERNHHECEFVTRCVLDASAGVELLFNTTRARSLSHQFPASAEWWVSEHYFVEVAGP